MAASNFRRAPAGFGGGSMGGSPLGGGLTPLGKRILTVLLSLYVGELLLFYWMDGGWITSLFLWTYGDGFAPWQFLTHPWIQDPSSPVGFLLELLGLYFLGAPVEASLGRRRFLILFLGIPLIAAVPAWLATSALLSGSPTAQLGSALGTLALLTAFALLNRSASLLLFFVIPVQAIWLLYGTVAVVSLTFLARSNPSGLYQLATIGLTWLWLSWGSIGGLRKMKLRWEEWRLKRRISRLRVVQGGKLADDDVIYH